MGKGWGGGPKRSDGWVCAGGVGRVAVWRSGCAAGAGRKGERGWVVAWEVGGGGVAGERGEGGA